MNFVVSLLTVKKTTRKAYCEKTPVVSTCCCILGIGIWFSKLVQMQIC